MSFDPAVRNRSLGSAMTLMERANPMQAMAEMLAIAQVIERYELNQLVVEEKQAPAEAIDDAIPHTGEDVQQASDWGTGEQHVAVSEGTVVELKTVSEVTSETVTEPKKAPSRKPKAKKAKAPRKVRAQREQVRDEVGTDTRSEGDPVPNGADPVPGETELPAAA